MSVECLDRLWEFNRLAESSEFAALMQWFGGHFTEEERYFFDAHNLHRQRFADTLLLGARTYLGAEIVLAGRSRGPTRSPAVANNPEVADVHREIGQRNNQMWKVVVFDTLTPAGTAP